MLTRVLRSARGVAATRGNLLATLCAGHETISSSMHLPASIQPAPLVRTSYHHGVSDVQALRCREDRRRRNGRTVYSPRRAADELGQVPARCRHFDGAGRGHSFRRPGRHRGGVVTETDMGLALERQTPWLGGIGPTGGRIVATGLSGLWWLQGRRIGGAVLFGDLRRYATKGSRTAANLLKCRRSSAVEQLIRNQ